LSSESSEPGYSAPSAASRGRRTTRRIATLATATALALGALTGTAAVSANAATPKPAAKAVTPSTDGPQSHGASLKAGLADRPAVRSNATTGQTAYAPTMDAAYQDYDGVVYVDGDDVGDGTWQTVYTDNNGLYRSLVDLGSVTGTAGEHDLMAIDGSGSMSLLSFTADTTTVGQATPRTIGGGWQTYNQVFTVGDVNGDGFPDVMARDHTGVLYFYAGTGSATAPFKARVKVGTGWNMYTQLVGANGRIIGRDTSGKLWSYQVNASGVMASRVEIGTGGWNTYTQLFTGDVNDDGVTDVIGHTATGAATYYLGSASSPSLAAGKALGSGWYGEAVQANEGNEPLWGRAGLWGRTSAGALDYYSTLGDNKIGSSQNIATSGWQPSYVPVLVGATSLDNEGLTDFAGTDTYPGVFTLESLSNTSTGDIETGTKYTAVVGAGDLNLDGKSDLIVRSTGGELYFLPGKGNGYSFGSRVAIGGGWNTYNRIVGGGDFSGDGIPDLLATTSGGVLYLYKGEGNGKFASRVEVGTGWGMYNKLAVVGDLNGDGYMDLAGVDSSGKLWGYDANGHGGVNSRIEIGTGGWNGFSSIG